MATMALLAENSLHATSLLQANEADEDNHVIGFIACDADSVTADFESGDDYIGDKSTSINCGATISTIYRYAVSEATHGQLAKGSRVLFQHSPHTVVATFVLTDQNTHFGLGTTPWGRKIAWEEMERLSQISLKSIALRLMKGIYSKTGSASDSELLTLAFDAIESAFAKKQISFINEVLSELDPTKTSAIVYTAILRITARAKHVLPAWERCYQKVVNALIESGEDPQILLYGIYKNKK